MFRFFSALCVVIALASSASAQCVGRCGDYVDNSFPCQCNEHCDTYGDCCPDYIDECLPTETCSGRCSERYNANNPCHCNNECLNYNNCCADYESVCTGTGSGGSCVGRCDTNLDSSQPCQCNSACENYGDCCSDYEAVCNSVPNQCSTQSISNEEIKAITLELFNLDVNRATSDQVHINVQSKTSDGSTQDVSPDPLFVDVDATLLSRPTYLALQNLLDNYEMTQGIDESVPQAELDEQDVFLDAFMATELGARLTNFLDGKGYTSCGDETSFKDMLQKMWFGLYSRQNGAMDTSGFEHVFVGEIKSGSVSGFHNWVQFYLEEQSGKVNYFGYISNQEPNLYGLHFTWNGYMKPIGGGFIGSSPEYELAVFTLCHMVKPDSVCQVAMKDDSGNEVTRSVQTWTWSKTDPGSGLKYVASSYFLT